MSAFADLVRFLPVSSGTGDWVVSSAVGGCQTPALANVQNGVSYKVYAVSTDLTQWEVSQGVYNSGTTTFPRTTVLYNSSGTGTATGQSGAGTKISFSTIPQVSVVAIAEDLVIYRSYLAGLTLSTAGSSATFSVAAGQAVDSTNIDVMTLAASISKTTGSWAVGSGNGALDTGAIANGTWYHAYLIKRPDTGVVDVLVSLSASAPTMPTNYTLSRRIGAMKTDGSAHWLAFTQYGDHFVWSAVVSELSAVTTLPTSLTALTLNGTPPGVSTLAYVRGIGNIAAAGNELLFANGDETTALDAIFGNRSVQVDVSGQAAAFQFALLTNSSAQIKYMSSTATWTNVSLVTYAYDDSRGRNS